VFERWHCVGVLPDWIGIKVKLMYDVVVPLGDSRTTGIAMYRFFLLTCALGINGLAFAQGTSAARPAITGISHLTLYADDLQKSQTFYSGLLGWEQVPAGAPQPEVRFYANHLQYIALKPAPSRGLANRFDSIGFSTSDAAQLRKFLEGHGVAVPPSIRVDEEGDKSFEVRDPEGNKVEFIQQGEHAPKAETALIRVSTHIIHAGIVARDRARLDQFYKDILGFHLYWEGGSGPGHTDWVMMQVPEGTDWLEYMLYLPSNPSREQLASAYHFAPGVVSVTELDTKLRQRGWIPSAKERPPLLGVDGKWQLDLFDPDGTRAEFMEFLPVKEPCCSRYTGAQPSSKAEW
jgi:catechol 2,3-dioxygenase-like lactoylglutathione lyase family enzyme